MSDEGHKQLLTKKQTMEKMIKSSLWALLLLVALTSCSKKDHPGSDPDDGDPAVGYIPVQDTKLTYTVTKGDEVGFSTVITVDNFRDSASYTVVDFTIEAAGFVHHSRGAYSVQQSVTYNDVPLLYVETVENLIKPQYNSVFTHEEHPFIMTIPHQDQSGATVLNETVVAVWHGVAIDPDEPHDETVADFSITYHAGTIVGSEKVTTALGTFDCLKIVFNRTDFTKYSLNGEPLVDYKSEWEMTTWLVKGIGSVKSREVNLSTGAISETELTKIEK